MPRRRAVQMPPPGANHPSRALDKGEALARAMEIEGRRAKALALSDLQTPPMPETWEIVEPGPSSYEIAAVALGVVALLLAVYSALYK